AVAAADTRPFTVRVARLFLWRAVATAELVMEYLPAQVVACLEVRGIAAPAERRPQAVLERILGAHGQVVMPTPACARRRHEATAVAVVVANTAAVVQGATVRLVPAEVD